MANISDAFGTIKVSRVGKEFIEFLNTTQGEGTDAYYVLADVVDFAGVEPDQNGDLSFTFSSFGRWSYGNNIEGYLNGTWMSSEKDKAAYNNLIEAMKKRGGGVEIEYSDSETGSNFMGTGVATLRIIDGETVLNNTFEEKPITIIDYAELNGYSEIEAISSIYGEDVADKYETFLQEFVGAKPPSADEWYENIYKEG